MATDLWYVRCEQEWWHLQGEESSRAVALRIMAALIIEELMLTILSSQSRVCRKYHDPDTSPSISSPIRKSKQDMFGSTLASKEETEGHQERET